MSTLIKLIVHNFGSDVHFPPSSECQPIGIATSQDSDYVYGYKPSYNYISEEIVNKSVKVAIRDTRCHSYDDNGLDVVQVSWIIDYDLHTVDPGLYLSNPYLYDCIFQIIDLSLYPKNAKYNLARLNHTSGIDYVLRICKLLSYAGKSVFTNSLKNQVLSWINNNDTVYPQPLSHNQWMALTKYDRKY
jgi:hypothetical protein